MWRRKLKVEEQVSAGAESSKVGLWLLVSTGKKMKLKFVVGFLNPGSAKKVE